MAASEPLFPPSLISPHVAASFPDSYTVRPLDRDDHTKGFLDCLRVLSHVGDVSEAQFQERFDWINTHGKGVHYHVVIEHESRIVGTGAMIVERKLCVQHCFPFHKSNCTHVSNSNLWPSIHDLGIIGHIEEIAIAKEYQGKGLGLKLLASLSSIAKNIGCYKTILGCSEKNEPFYVKCGYEKNGQVMSQYYEEPKEPYYRG